MTSTGASTWRELLRLPAVRWYLTGFELSGVGDSAFMLAGGVWVLALTGSASLAALVGFCTWLPSLAGPVFGLVADRVDRRRLIIVANLVIAAVMTTLLAVRGPGQVWLIFAAMLAYGAFAAITDPAELALLHDLLPGRALGTVNSARMTLTEGNKLIAPLLGAGLYAALGGGTVALLDAATFTAAALTTTMIKLPPRPTPQPASEAGGHPDHPDQPARPAGRAEPAGREPAERHWFADVAAGVRYLWGAGAVRGLAAAAATTLCMTGFLTVCVFDVVTRSLHQPPAFVGVVSAGQGLGSVVGGLVAPALLRRFREPTLVAAGATAAFLGTLLYLVPLAPVPVAGSAFRGAGLAWVLIGLMTLVQRTTPGELQGRVNGALSTVVFAPMTLATAAGAGVVTLTGYRPMLVGGAVVVLGAALGAAVVARRPPQEDSSVADRSGSGISGSSG
jgi:MFS family permease